MRPIVAGKRVKFSALMGFLRASLAQIPEHRRGHNGHDKIADAGQSAFAVFFMQEGCCDYGNMRRGLCGEQEQVL